jgi:hypothetical protein
MQINSPIRLHLPRHSRLRGLAVYFKRDLVGLAGHKHPYGFIKCGLW